MGRIDPNSKHKPAITGEPVRGGGHKRDTTSARVAERVLRDAHQPAPRKHFDAQARTDTKETGRVTKAAAARLVRSSHQHPSLQGRVTRW